jgi:hypothetical protein
MFGARYPLEVAAVRDDPVSASALRSADQRFLDRSLRDARELFTTSWRVCADVRCRGT